MDIRGYLEATWADYADKLLREVDARLESAVGGIKRGGKLNAATLAGTIPAGSLPTHTHSDYAVAAKGVTNGDTHDHAGDDGALIPNAALAADVKPAILDVPTITGLLTLSGGQIKFPAAQSASADPSTLDDYEEGTWTPDLQFSGAKVGITYAFTPLGRYIKTGGMVWVTFDLALTSKGTSAGQALIKGLPFVVGAMSVGLPVGYQESLPWVLQLRADGANSYIVPNYCPNGSTASVYDSDFANTTRIIGTGFYSVIA